MPDKVLNEKWEVLNGIFSATGNREDGKLSKILLAIDEALKSHTPGQIQYDPITKVPTVDTGITGVRISIGLESYIPFFNDTGEDIPNGKPINASGVDATNSVFKGIIADSTSPATSSSVIGVSTHLVPDQTIGFATIQGTVNDMPTNLWSIAGPLYLGAGTFTQTRPVYPANIVIIGSIIKQDAITGKIFVKPSVFNRRTGNKSYSFTSNGVSSGIYYLGGFYDFSATSINLTQSALTQSYGDALAAYCAHASVIFGGSGVVDSGVVGLRINGTSITDLGILTESDSEIISNDITVVLLNEYLESTKKWVGTIEFELFTVSGTPTAYDLTFNYGYAKYEDIGNQDFTIKDFEVVGVAGANDTAFDVELIHHKFTGWTYSASGFEPGNGVITSMSSVLGIYNTISNTKPFAFKRIGLNQFIDGNGPEGIVVRITAGQNNSVQSLNVHISAVSEELT